MDPEIEVEHRKRLEHRDDHSHEGRDAERPKGRTSAVLVCAQQGDDEDGEMTPPTRNTGLRFSTPRPPKRLTNSEGSKRRPASARRYVLDAQSILTSTAALTGGVDEMAGQTSVKMLRD
jgi:hypothetical protein